MGEKFVKRWVRIIFIVSFLLNAAIIFLLIPGLSLFDIYFDTVYGKLVILVIALYSTLNCIALSEKAEKFLWHIEFKKNKDLYLAHWYDADDVRYLHDNFPYMFYSILEKRPELKSIIVAKYPEYFKID